MLCPHLPGWNDDSERRHAWLVRFSLPVRENTANETAAQDRDRGDADRPLWKGSPIGSNWIPGMPVASVGIDVPERLNSVAVHVEPVANVGDFDGPRIGE